MQVFAGDLADGAKVVGLLNRHSFQTQYPVGAQLLCCLLL